METCLNKKKYLAGAQPGQQRSINSPVPEAGAPLPEVRSHPRSVPARPPQDYEHTEKRKTTP